MIDEHITLVELSSNHLMQLVVLTQKEKYWWIEMFKMIDIMVKKTQNKRQVVQPFVKHWEKHYPTF